MQLDWWQLTLGVIGLAAGIVQILNWFDIGPPILPWTMQRRRIRRFLRAEVEEIGSSYATGTSQIRFRDLLFENDLYIQPRWEHYEGMPPEGDLIAFLTEKLNAGENVLLVGESGQGKSTVLKRLFVTLAGEIIRRRRKQMPIYVRLRDFYAFSDERLTLESLWNFLKGGSRTPFPLTFDQFSRMVRGRHIAFLFDGFDEIQGSPSQNIINLLAGSSVFSFTSVLSCRITFYETYLRISPIQATYRHKVRLKYLKFDQVSHFITAFCRHTSTPNPQVLIDGISRSNSLMDITKRSLLLVMVVDMMTESGLQGKTLQSPAQLYEEYTRKWLIAEASKPGVIIGWNEKHDLMKILAWEMQKNPQEAPGVEINWSASIPKAGVIEIIQRFLDRPLGKIYDQWPLPDLINDIFQHSFLEPSKNADAFYFSHKSFQEFYAARYVFDVLNTEPQAVEETLSEHLPVEIASFLKEMLKSGSLDGRNRKRVERNLEQAYSNNLWSGNSLLREQASYYLACLESPHGIQFLEEIYPKEPEKFVQRGILVGLAILCRRPDIMDRYIQILHEDPEADSINLGYHLMYYGDSPFELETRDKNNDKCDGTVRAILRHLRDEKYRCGWALDLLTLRRLMETRGTGILTEQDRSRVLEFINREKEHRQASFKAEKQLLETIIKGGLHETRDL